MLALQFGMPVSELSQRLPYAELVMWMAYYQMNPFGDQRADLRSAQVCQLIYNTNSKRPKKMDEFLLFDRKRVRGESNQELRSNFESFIARKQARKK